MIKLYFAVLIALAAADCGDKEDRCLWGKSYLKVQTSTGPVEGFLGKSCRLGKQFAGFRGIPYAEPPVGELRFRDPVPKKNWNDTWDATFQRPSCAQIFFGETTIPNPDGFSEDCLYLSVYTPNLKYLKYGLGSPKAVMVFIHPGAFNTGSSTDSIFSPDFLIDQDVVVVSFNYRLGALGFLSFQNEEVPGNAGLKDQNLALKWIKKNIRNFGGDPSRITIFGESAGSASVHYHILSKASEGLFSRAIMESGVALSRWAYSPPQLALKKARGLAKKVGCSQGNFTKILECMQKVPVENIIKKQQKTLTMEEVFSLRIIAFHPTAEPNVPGAFLTADPFDLMYSGNFTKVPTIIGFNSNEGLLIYPSLLKNGFVVSLVSLDLSRFAPYNFHLIPFTKPAIHVHNMISRFYFNSKTLSKALMWNLLELVTDVMFTLPIQLTASLLQNSSVPVYNYYFTYVGNYNVVKIRLNISDAPGACHGDDVGYLFYIKTVQTECGNPNISNNSQDELMIDRMTKMWTNFAKTGEPTPRLDPQIGCKWEPFTATKSNYLDIGRHLVPSVNLKMANMEFWNSVVKDLIQMRVGKIGEQNSDDTEYLDESTD